jgi:hypothetical protein
MTEKHTSRVNDRKTYVHNSEKEKSEIMVMLKRMVVDVSMEGVLRWRMAKEVTG